MAGGLHLPRHADAGGGSPRLGQDPSLHLDHLGTPRLITGNGGAELSRHNYHPFGVEIEPTSTSATPPTREKKQFTGHERDAESLDYMHARFYAPYMGRFLSADPTWESAHAGRPQTWNRYAYVTNDPLNHVDPDGRNPLGALVGGSIAVTVESWKQVRSGRPVNNKRLATAFASGATAGFVGGLGTTIKAAIGLGTVGGVAGGAVDRGLNGDRVVSGRAIAIDAVTGAVGGAIGNTAGKAAVGTSARSGALNSLTWKAAAQRAEAAAANGGAGADSETVRQAVTVVKGLTGAGDAAGNVAGAAATEKLNDVRITLTTQEREPREK